jgi:hypothetical protein
MQEKAINMYITLRKFPDVNRIMLKHGNKVGTNVLDPVILVKQAEYARDCGNWKEAADLY